MTRLERFARRFGVVVTTHDIDAIMQGWRSFAACLESGLYVPSPDEVQ
jgi:hypothetical protein